ncbi:MAG: PepSY domain-containing protein [Luteitalea sp.]|nr:PepSY domain-containing protein [Luteitalea sp.]
MTRPAPASYRTWRSSRARTEETRALDPTKRLAHRSAASLPQFTTSAHRLDPVLGGALMKLRTLIFWPHLIAGVSAGAVILLMSVTGVLLTYERQMIAWADSDFRSVVPSSGAERLPVETVLERFRQQRSVVPTAITIGSATDAPVTLTVPQQTLYADAYTGNLLGEGSEGVRPFMTELRAWHRWLAVDGEGRPVARAITGWSNFIFLFIVVSGVYLWFPRTWMWRQVKPVVVFNGKLRGKARDFNWHNVIGSWSAVILFIVVLGAMPISFPWANALVYRLVGEEPPAPAGGRRAPVARTGAAASVRGGGRSDEAQPPTGLDSGARNRFDGLNTLWARAERQVPGWRTINLRIPTSATAPVVFAIDKGNGGQPQLRSTLTLDRSTRDILSYEDFSDQSLGRQLRSILRFAHTGEVLGIGGQTLAGFASAGGAVLVWTGLALAIRRFRAWLKRRAGYAVPQEQSTSAESGFTVQN